MSLRSLKVRTGNMVYLALGSNLLKIFKEGGDMIHQKVNFFGSRMLAGDEGSELKDQ